MFDDALHHRIRAHRSAPDVYDPPTFEQMADRIEELVAKLAKATEALKYYAQDDDDGGWLATETLAELTRGNDE